MVGCRVRSALALTLALLFTSRADAFVHEIDRYGARIKWASPTLIVHIAPGAAQLPGMAEAFTLAAHAYVLTPAPDGAQSALRFVPAAAGAAQNAHIVIDKRTPPPAASRFVAVTDVETGLAGVATHATIWLNAAHPMSLTPAQGETDLVSVLVHELGHAAGLGHTPDRRAVMHGGVHNGEQAHRTLKDDDIRGIIALYKEGGAARAPVPVAAQPKPSPAESKCDCLVARASSPTSMAVAMLAVTFFCGVSRKRRPGRD